MKLILCDRCRKEIKKESFDLGLNNPFLESFGVDSLEELNVHQDGKVSNVKVLLRVKKPQLCQDCIPGYNDIIKEANAKVNEYLEVETLETKPNKKYKLFKR